MAAAWIHIYTGQSTHLNQAKTYLSQVDMTGEYSWADKDLGVKILVHSLTQDATQASEIKTLAEEYLPGNEFRRLADVHSLFVNINIHTYQYIHILIHIHMPILIHMHTYTHAHTCTHTNTYTY